MEAADPVKAWISTMCWPWPTSGRTNVNERTPSKHVSGLEGDIRRQSDLTIDQCAKPDRAAGLIDLRADRDLEVIGLLRSDAGAQPRAAEPTHAVATYLDGLGGATTLRLDRSRGVAKVFAIGPIEMLSGLTAKLSTFPAPARFRWLGSLDIFDKNSRADGLNIQKGVLSVKGIGQK